MIIFFILAKVASDLDELVSLLEIEYILTNLLSNYWNIMLFSNRNPWYKFRFNFEISSRQSPSMIFAA